ncbi:MAG: hypothetical protein AAF990_22610 [Bacteroidota bacterium]
MKFIEFCIKLFKKKDNNKKDTYISFDSGHENLHEYHNPWLSIRS